MGTDTLQTIWLTLLGLAGVAAILALVYFIAAFVGWRGPFRRQRFLKAIIFACAVPMLIGAQQIVIYKVFLPAAKREQRAKIRELTKEHYAAASFINIGDKAPPFHAKTSDGKELSLDDLKGKVVLINFFATWCGPCRLELPHIEEIYNANKDNKDFTTIVIGREETDESVAEFKLKNNYTFPIAPDTDSAIFSQFAKQLIPRTYLIGRDGTICFTAIGFYEDDITDLKEEIAKQLDSK